MENMKLAFIIFILFFIAMYLILFVKIIGKKIDKHNNIPENKKN